MKQPQKNKIVEWGTYTDYVLRPAVKYILERKRGEHPIFKTGISSFDDAHAGGVETGNTTVISGRPGFGKTVFKDQIIRGLLANNDPSSFRLLDIQMELAMQTVGVRQIGAEVGKSYKELISANDNTLSDDEYIRSKEAAKKLAKHKNLHVVKNVVSIPEFVDLVKRYMHDGKCDKEVKVKKEGIVTTRYEAVYTPTIITLDHTLLLDKQGMDEQTFLDKLFNEITQLKREFPVAFIIIHQMNRDIEHPGRCQNRSFLNFPRSTDLRGADVIYHHADVLLAFHRPFKFNISEYGPEGYPMSENILIGHYIKARNNSVRMSFYHINGKNFTVKSINIEDLDRIYRKEAGFGDDPAQAIQTSKI